MNEQMNEYLCINYNKTNIVMHAKVLTVRSCNQYTYTSRTVTHTHSYTQSHGVDSNKCQNEEQKFYADWSEDEWKQQQQRQLVCNTITSLSDSRIHKQWFRRLGHTHIYIVVPTDGSNAAAKKNLLTCASSICSHIVAALIIILNVERWTFPSILVVGR